MKSIKHTGMSLIVRTAMRLCIGFILLYGINILMKGHDSCGGAFVGGVIVALTFINMMVVFGKKEALKELPRNMAVFFQSRAGLMLFSFGLLIFVWGYLFLNIISNGQPFSLYDKGVISFSHIEIILKTATGIFAIFSIVLLLQYKETKGDA
ncbi:MAG: hypothetical protein HQL13_01585 [Candidatus Omnitrophica bacterium]|nr:hypothetical protein [Candidatus Omnitrophota bacterium]